MRVGVCVISRLTSHLLQFASTRVDFNLSCHQQYNIVVYSLPSPIFKKRRSWSNQFHVCLLECLNTLNIESSLYIRLSRRSVSSCLNELVKVISGPCVSYVSISCKATKLIQQAVIFLSSYHILIRYFSDFVCVEITF